MERAAANQATSENRGSTRGEMHFRPFASVRMIVITATGNSARVCSYPRPLASPADGNRPRTRAR